MGQGAVMVQRQLEFIHTRTSTAASELSRDGVSADNWLGLPPDILGPEHDAEHLGADVAEPEALGRVWSQ